MQTNKTITIKGRTYDRVTGLPISERVYDQVIRVPNGKNSNPTPETKKPEEKKKLSPAVKRDAATTAAQVHGQTQRSQTLLRRITKKPAAPAKRPTTGRHMDMARSLKITKFAPHPVVTPATVTPQSPKTALKPDKPAQIHPLAARALARVSNARPVASKPATSKEVKDAVIAKALAAPKQKPQKAAKKVNKMRRHLFIVAGIILALGLTTYAVYRFVPAVSVSIASAQAGVNATYPEYVPDGYSLDHPVTYTDGQVALKFKQNGNKENHYTITQTRSSWDSSAVLDNVVRADAGENYITTKERGLTVYSYGNNAAWVNGGVMYAISSSNAPLSGEQIRHIATSL